MNREYAASDLGVYDLTAAERLTRRRTPRRIKVADHTYRAWVSAAIGELDAEYAMSAPLAMDRPLLFVTLEGDAGLLLIDGRHRLYRAVQDQREELNAHILSRAESALIFRPGATVRGKWRPQIGGRR